MPYTVPRLTVSWPSFDPVTISPRTITMLSLHAISHAPSLSKSIFKKQLFFPQPGETIVLEETKSMLSAIGAEKPKQTVLKVRGLYPRGEGASTATITLVR